MSAEPLHLDTWHKKKIDTMTLGELRRALREEMRARFVDIRELHRRYQAQGYARLNDDIPGPRYDLGPAIPRPQWWVMPLLGVTVLGCFTLILNLMGAFRW